MGIKNRLPVLKNECPRCHAPTGHICDFTGSHPRFKLSLAHRERWALIGGAIKYGSEIDLLPTIYVSAPPPKKIKKPKKGHTVEKNKDGKSAACRQEQHGSCFSLYCICSCHGKLS